MSGEMQQRAFCAIVAVLIGAIFVLLACHQQALTLLAPPVQDNSPYLAVTNDSPVTLAEVALATGEELSVPVWRDAKRPFGQQLYVYRNNDCIVQLTVSRSEYMPEAARQRGLTAAKLFYDIQAQSGTVQAIADLGDDAFWLYPGLHILYKNMYISIMVKYRNGEDTLAAAMFLAGKMLPRLSVQP